MLPEWGKCLTTAKGRVMVKKNEAWVKVGSSIAATMVCYLVINIFASELEILWKIVTASIVGVVALIVAFWGGNKEATQEVKPSPQTEAGTNIKAKGSVSLEGVTVGTDTGGDVRVASNIEAEKNVVIKDVHVKQKG